MTSAPPSTTMGFQSDINEELLRQFEEEFEVHKTKLEQAREAVKHQKSLAIQHEIQSKNAALAQLDGHVIDARESRKALRKQLTEKRMQMKVHLAEQQELKRNTWNVERDHCLEDAAHRRLELARLQDERKRIESLLDVATIQLDAIESEKARRHESQADTIARLLTRGAVLKQQLDDGLLSVPEVHESIQAHDRFVDECQSLRLVQQEQAAATAHARLKQLNDERTKLLAEEEALRDRERQHAYLTDKGVDFWVEMKLGHAPPVELVLKNMPASESSVTLDDNNDALDEVLAQAIEMVATGESKLTIMTNDIASIERTRFASMEENGHATRPYDGSLGIQSYTPSQLGTQSFVLELVLDLIDELPLAAVATTLAELKTQTRQWKATQRQLAKARRRHAKAQAVVLWHHALLDDVVDEVLRDVYKELHTTHQRFASMVTSTLLQALLPSTTAADDPRRPLLASTLGEIQRQRQQNSSKRFHDTPGLVPFDLHRLSQAVVEKPPDGGEGPTAASSTKKKWFGGAASSVSEETKLPAIRAPPAATVVALNQVPHVDPPPALITAEKTYWRYVELEPVPMTLPIATTTCVHIGVCQGRLVLYAGGAKGEVVVLDLVDRTVLLQCLDPVKAGLTTAIDAFASHVLVMSATSPQLKLWTMRPTPKANAPSLVFGLTKDDLSRPGTADISAGCFAPALSLVGTPTSVVVGTQDGSIVRLNRSPDDCRAVVGSADARRETFQFHRAAIVAVAHVATDVLVSVDVTGIVALWDYSPRAFTGFGWFAPTATLGLDLHGGIIQQAHVTTMLLPPRLVVFVYDAAKRYGQVVQVALSTHQPLHVVPVVIRLGCAPPAPPFALLPPLEGLPTTDYIVFLATTITIYSLATGAAVGPTPSTTISPSVSLTVGGNFIVGCGNGKLMALILHDRSPDDVCPTRPLGLARTQMQARRLQAVADDAARRQHVDEMLHQVVVDATQRAKARPPGSATAQI
ncbi:Aste57867_21378 [Aphanomyces stellatus]|uniref:Aste57867_21378 protein n=1 Tax=Aphanomyces stellatus TaxID=120398 RepID=A0A485LHB1_9STRA|nr:hypothetical protein As57867_021309 [Aphanomyces stellatus]VFT98050.1 Aste57867_21378 [Aphanomyces stellatus]